MPSLSYTLPAPTSGMNTRDDLASLPELECRSLCNLIPSNGVLKIRKGYRFHAGGMGAAPIKTLAEYAGPTGTRHLIACANGNIYNASTYNTNATSLASGFAVDNWQYTNFRGNLILCNGTDQPKKWDGSSLTDATYTGVGLTDNDLIDVTSYKTRLYFVKKNSTSFWYGGISSITGALTEVDVGDILKQGGYIQTIKTLSQDTGNGLEDLLVIISDTGEILTYSGLYPGDSTWKLVGRYFIGPPIGRRCAENVATDLIIISLNGAISLSEVMRNARVEDPSHQITNKINKTFYDYQEDYGDNFGWQPFYYGKGNLFMINIPLAQYAQSEQLVANLDNGAWSIFSGLNAVSWSCFKKKPYFGGADGNIYEWDFGYLDNSNADITIKLSTAFNYIGDKQHNKEYLMIRPLFFTDRPFLMSAYVATNFGGYGGQSVIGAPVSSLDGGEWDNAEWNNSYWAGGQRMASEWYSITGFGRSVSVQLAGSAFGANLSIHGIDIMFKTGGVV